MRLPTPANSSNLVNGSDGLFLNFQRSTARRFTRPARRETLLPAIKPKIHFIIPETFTRRILYIYRVCRVNLSSLYRARSLPPRVWFTGAKNQRNRGILCHVLAQLYQFYTRSRFLISFLRRNLEDSSSAAPPAAAAFLLLGFLIIASFYSFETPETGESKRGKVMMINWFLNAYVGGHSYFSLSLSPNEENCFTTGCVWSWIRIGWLSRASLNHWKDFSFKKE